MSTTENNLKGIKKNRRSLFELEGQVMVNKARSYATRSNIEENRYLIVKNYVAAFVGNRQLANQNTDDIFQNRIAILENIEQNIYSNIYDCDHIIPIIKFGKKSIIMIRADNNLLN